MAFIKINRSRKSLNVPALHINKNMSFLNKPFCFELGLKKEGDSTKFDIMYDQEKDLFAISIHEEGESTMKVNRSLQLQIYLKSIFRSVGKELVENCIVPVEYKKKLDLWLFAIPEDKVKKPKKDKLDKIKKKKKKRKKHGTLGHKD